MYMYSCIVIYIYAYIYVYYKRLKCATVDINVLQNFVNHCFIFTFCTNFGMLDVMNVIYFSEISCCYLQFGSIVKKMESNLRC